MTLTYIQTLGLGFPAVKCYAIGDGSIYANLVWESGDPLPAQAVLDAWGAANTQVITDSTTDKTVISVYSGSTSAMSGTSTIPADNTTPQVTEGTQIWSRSITPKTASSSFIVNQTFVVDSSSSNRNITFAFFRNSTCIYAGVTNLATAGRPTSFTLNVVDAPAVTSAVTYSLRVGANSSGTWYLNQSNASAITYGGTVNASAWTITEIK